MLLSALLSVSALASGVLATCGEPTKRICFGPDGGDSQNVDIEDIKYAATVVRGMIKDPKKNFSGAFWNMPAGDFGCAEWMVEIPDSGTVLTLIKKVSPRSNSSVLFDDVANTIDGGPNPTEEQLSKSLLGCGTNGGMIGIQWNSSNPIYTSERYLATGAKPDGLIMKLVRAPN
ncbi:hypothetical protein QBC34DRAFT_401272 [Podospora aff. communis PSN243]|uniref:Ecp2 effector protein domain-containing protein n=1 Tax=Podospora aff. communis PSN243 TaxID=3040156 RepID=A0AAV9GTF4_9PEZI|nr:hypothetical protein QBC34DRAFT_401272 [Podospora aff. communis PSN243]